MHDPLQDAPQDDLHDATDDDLQDLSQNADEDPVDPAELAQDSAEVIEREAPQPALREASASPPGRAARAQSAAAPRRSTTAPDWLPPSVASVIDRFVTRRVVRWIAVAATIGMFLVLALGVVVTNTDSGHGCGGTWPLCNGKFIPGYAVQAAIEYTHRLVTGIEGLLVVALVLGALYYWRARREIRILAPLMFLFLLIQSALGAIVALTTEAPELVAMHFGISLISFVTIVLTTAILLQERTYDRLRDRPIRRGFRRLVWGLTVYTYVVVYTGAYVQHKGVQLECSGWPLCNGQVLPTLTGGVAIVFTHRIAALVLALGTVWLFLWARQVRRARPDLYWGSLTAFVLVIAQALEGAWIVGSRLSLASEIGHGAVVSLYFAALCYLVLQVSRRPREVRALVRPRQPTRAASPVQASPS